MLGQLLTHVLNAKYTITFPPSRFPALKIYKLKNSIAGSIRIASAFVYFDREFFRMTIFLHNSLFAERDPFRTVPNR